MQTSYESNNFGVGSPRLQCSAILTNPLRNVGGRIALHADGHEVFNLLLLADERAVKMLGPTHDDFANDSVKRFLEVEEKDEDAERQQLGVLQQRTDSMVWVVCAATCRTAILCISHVGIDNWLQRLLDTADKSFANMVRDQQAPAVGAFKRRALSLPRACHATAFPANRPPFMKHDFARDVVQLDRECRAACFGNLSWEAVGPQTFAIAQFSQLPFELHTRVVKGVVEHRAARLS